MDELFPKKTNPRLKSLPGAAKHSMGKGYIKILNNQLAELVYPNGNLDLLYLHKLMPLSICLTDTDEVGKKSLIRFKQVSKEM